MSALSLVSLGRVCSAAQPVYAPRSAEELSDPTLETGENTHTDNNGDLQDNVLGGANGEKVESEDDEALLHSAMGGSAGFNGDGESEIKVRESLTNSLCIC